MVKSMTLTTVRINPRSKVHAAEVNGAVTACGVWLQTRANRAPSGALSCGRCAVVIGEKTLDTLNKHVREAQISV